MNPVHGCAQVWTAADDSTRVPRFVPYVTQ
jgi:hypothetical protein